MKNVLVLCACLITLTGWTQQFQGESAGSLTFYSDRVMQLVDAFPADKFDWSPSDGVRSFASVAAHVVSANYFFAMKLGATIPETVNMQTIETDLKTKEQLKAALTDSYALVIGAVKGLANDDLATKVEFPFPGEYTKMSAAMIAVTHSSEHSGQLVAYARSNNITPPWSQGD